MSTANLNEIVSQVYSRISFDSIDIGIICGSGLSGLATKIQNAVSIPYSEISGFPHSAVAGHKNELVFGTIGDKRVVALRGRFHFYEGWHPKDVVIGMQLIAALGAKAAIVTNAAGGVNPDFTIGDLMIIEDHISMVSIAGNSSLMGLNDDTMGPRFPSISSVYDAGFGKVFAEAHKDIAEEMNHTHELQKGCYVGVAGPNYESRHEIEYFRTIGGSSVGMSTVMEVIQAAHCGIKVLGLSLITNNCLGTRPEEYNLPEPNHAEVVAETAKVESFVQRAVEEFISRVDLTNYNVAPMSSNFTREAMASREVTPKVAEKSEGCCSASSACKACTCEPNECQCTSDSCKCVASSSKQCPITKAACGSSGCPITAMIPYVLTGVISSVATLFALGLFNKRN